jgi:hypothetical protein
MSADTGKENTEPDDINVGLIATVAVVGALLVFAIALALTALVRSESSERGTSVGAYSDLGTVARLKAEQRAKLEAAPAWADRAKGEVAVPIDRAMEMVTADIRKDPNRATATAAAPAASVAPPAGSATMPTPPAGPAGAPPGRR